MEWLTRFRWNLLLTGLLILLPAKIDSQSLQKIDLIRSISEPVHYFSKDLFKAMGRKGSFNTVVSPLSVFMAVSMTSAGAKGSTLEQILQTLRLPENYLSRSGGMANMVATLRSEDSDDVVLDMANFLWVPRGVALKADFARKIQDVFQSRVRDADFSRAEEVRQLVNLRVSNMTRGHIPELLPRGAISAQTVMLLANAVYFKGPWFHAFNQSQTYPEAFYMDSSRSLLVPMMHMSEMFQGGILDDLDAKAVLLPYEDKRYGLLLVLPNRLNGLNDLENQLFNSSYTPTTLLRKMIHRDVNLTLPKFQIKFEMEMSSTMQTMGIVDLFSNDADLTGMSSSARMAKLKVSNFFHQATIEVNEGGSEASAASGMDIIPLMGGVGPHFGPIEFKADHPFLFYLIDRDNDNIPIFMGRMMNPLHNQPIEYNRIRNQDVELPITNTIQKNRFNGISTSANPENFPQKLPSARPFLPPRNKPIFGSTFDEILFPQSTPYHPFYNPTGPLSIYRNGFDLVPRNPHLAELLFAPSRQEIHNPVLFPGDDSDEHFDRLKRGANPWAFPEEESIPEPKPLKESSDPSTEPNNEEISLRGQDKYWFKKPPLEEVFIPVNTPDQPQNSPSSEKRRPQYHVNKVALNNNNQNVNPPQPITATDPPTKLTAERPEASPPLGFSNSFSGGSIGNNPNPSNFWSQTVGNHGFGPGESAANPVGPLSGFPVSNNPIRPPFLPPLPHPFSTAPSGFSGPIANNANFAGPNQDIPNLPSSALPNPHFTNNPVTTFPIANTGILFPDIAYRLRQKLRNE